MSYSHDELRAEKLDDFRVFLVHVWAFLKLPKPTRTQLDIAYWLQHGPSGASGAAPDRAILQAFRGVGKSWITVAFVLWILLWDPQKKIMVVSAGEALASNFTKFCMQLISGMPLLQHLAPKRDQRRKSDSFDVAPALADKDPSVKSVGITGQITGSRADIIIADDVETPKNSYTQLLRERLAELVKEFDAVLKPLPGARVIFLGTPQVEDSLYVKLQKRGYVTSIWPAQVPEKLDKYGGRLAGMVQRMAEKLPPGTPVDPARFDREDLEARRLSYGRAGYALQFMLDTSPSDAEKHPLKLKDLIVHDVDGELGHVKLVWSGESAYTVQDLVSSGFDGDHYQRASWKSEEMAKFSRVTMAIDPSGRGTDETSYAILKELHGMLYLVDIGGYLDGFGEDTLKALAGKAAQWGVNKIIIEDNYGGGMFRQLLRPHLQRVNRDVIDDEWDAWAKGNKENRILDILEPVVNNHRLVVDRKVIERDLKFVEDDPDRNNRYSFTYQFTRMSRVKGELLHDDRIDALAMIVGYATERMSRDSDKMIAKHKEAALMAELKRFSEGVLGRPIGKPKWASARRR